MSKLSYLPPRTRAILLKAEATSSRWRDHGGRLNVVQWMESLYPDLTVSIEDYMIDANGKQQVARFECGVNPKLSLTDIVYEGAISGKSADRFTIAHELGHFYLHNQEFASGVGLGRGIVGSGTSFKSNPLAEQEANAFAGGCLLPLDAIDTTTQAWQAAEKYGISEEAATFALKRARAAFPKKWVPGNG
jgi:Zn-dependent peptidase ImmA (M78 family)